MARIQLKAPLAEIAELTEIRTFLPRFRLAESLTLGNDLLWVANTYRDGTLQAVKRLALADQSKRVAKFKKGRWSSGI